MESIYLHFFRAQRRTSLLFLNIIEILAKIVVLILQFFLYKDKNANYLGYATCTAIFLLFNCVICLIVYRSTQNRRMLTSAGVATWLLQTLQLTLLLWSEYYGSRGINPVAEGLWYAMYVIFSAHTTLPVKIYVSWIMAFCTTIITLTIQIAVADHSPKEVRQFLFSSYSPLFYCL